MPNLTRPDGIEIYWEERGDGPLVIFSPSFFNDATVFRALLDDLAADHRVVTWDPRGTGRSSRAGPYDLPTDVGDLGAVIDAAGSRAVLIDMMAPRSIELGVREPDRVAAVVSAGAAPPLGSEELEGEEGFSGSAEVIGGLMRLLESDFRSAARALIDSTSPSMPEDELRLRVDDAAEKVDASAAAGRLKVLRSARRLLPQAAELGPRLYVTYFDTPWYPPRMFEHARSLLPDADFTLTSDGPISRPDETAAVVRRATAGLR